MSFSTKESVFLAVKSVAYSVGCETYSGLPQQPNL